MVFSKKELKNGENQYKWYFPPILQLKQNISLTELKTGIGVLMLWVDKFWFITYVTNKKNSCDKVKVLVQFFYT